jgi:hypothetical protein
MSSPMIPLPKRAKPQLPPCRDVHDELLPGVSPLVVIAILLAVAVCGGCAAGGAA